MDLYNEFEKYYNFDITETGWKLSTGLLTCILENDKIIVIGDRPISGNLFQSLDDQLMLPKPSAFNNFFILYRGLYHIKPNMLGLFNKMYPGLKYTTLNGILVLQTHNNVVYAAIRGGDIVVLNNQDSSHAFAMSSLADFKELQYNILPNEPNIIIHPLNGIIIPRDKKFKSSIEIMDLLISDPDILQFTIVSIIPGFQQNSEVNIHTSLHTYNLFSRRIISNVERIQNPAWTNYIKTADDMIPNPNNKPIWDKICDFQPLYESNKLFVDNNRTYYIYTKKAWKRISTRELRVGIGISSKTREEFEMVENIASICE